MLRGLFQEEHLVVAGKANIATMRFFRWRRSRIGEKRFLFISLDPDG